ncbi:MAG: hypothetical protein INH41_30120 [Myxococcaceae bacterium]|jgi:hypothetical protein|nr:hypothetical protein [Myxococcaceae bacterium]MCA3016661.1 hypothetical protein [Myxococcaceae bacterium]
MSLVFSALVTTALAAPDIGLALTKRSGVSKPVGVARARLVGSKLNLDGEPEDFTECQSRLPCVLKAARAKKWAALVTVETANVLSEGIIAVRLISVDEDGRQLAVGEARGPEESLDRNLDQGLLVMRSALRAMEEALAASTRRATPPDKMPLADLPPPPPPPTPSLTDRGPGAPGGRPPWRWVPLGVSLTLLAAGSVCLGLSEGAASRLRTQTPLDQSQVDGLVASGKSLQSIGLAGTIAGGVLTAASLVLALFWPDARASVSVFWAPGAGGLGLSGRLP